MVIAFIHLLGMATNQESPKYTGIKFILINQKLNKPKNETGSFSFVNEYLHEYLRDRPDSKQ